MADGKFWGKMMVAFLGLSLGLASKALGQAPAGRSAVPVKAAAIVNGEVIPQAELDKLLEHMPPSPTPLTAEQKQQLRKMALEMLIDDALMRQFLKRTGIPVNPAELAKEWEDLRQGLAKNQSSLEKFLQESGQTEEQLRADLVARLQWKAYLTAQVPDHILRTYYEQNKVFFDKVFVRARHILIRVDPKASPQEKAAARAKLAAIRQDILAGKLDFAQAARLYSDCPSRANGGDIGHFPYKFAVHGNFARTAFALKKGEISDIIETDFGYHILQVLDRTAGEPSTFEGVKDWVREAYAQEHELYQRILQQERSRARIEIVTP